MRHFCSTKPLGATSLTDLLEQPLSRLNWLMIHQYIRSNVQHGCQGQRPIPCIGSNMPQPKQRHSLLRNTSQTMMHSLMQTLPVYPSIKRLVGRMKITINYRLVLAFGIAHKIDGENEANCGGNSNPAEETTPSVNASKQTTYKRLECTNGFIFVGFFFVVHRVFLSFFLQLPYVYEILCSTWRHIPFFDERNLKWGWIEPSKCERTSQKNQIHT